MIDTSIKAGLEDIPTRVSEEPPIINNAESESLLKRMESIDTERAQVEQFRSLVEANADEMVTLEDGTTKTLRELSEEFADDEKLLTEITTCAVG